jgi:hypothetical protein
MKHLGAEKLAEGEINSPGKIVDTFKTFGLYDPEAIRFGLLCGRLDGDVCACRILAGYFNESLAAATPEFSRFALLRLDGDTYESTIQALEVCHSRRHTQSILALYACMLVCARFFTLCCRLAAT